MNHFFVYNARNLKRFLFLTIAAVLSIGVIWAERDNVSVFAPHPPSAIYNVPTDRKVVALTFDISWGDKRAEPILDILKNKGVNNVTFFLSSPWSKTHPEIVKKIVDGGYEIGSHGHKHDNYSQYSEDEIRRQIQTAHDILSDMTGRAPNLIRMPNGDFDKRVLRVAESMNYKVIQWDTDSLDWKNPGVDAIVSKVVTKAHPGDIILLHASDSCKQTHEALPIIIDQLRAQGYEFVTVSQLLSQTETKGQTVEDRSAWTEMA
ncbi:polysaccharide deacetylase family sporulation protein PdaB [Cohnella lubricantis]|uniref:Polysaccharide deacetylase family sporulation protein PdaB n=1 Tax=Cohnella lubricantis TaxID=2163172 RepID=A0A841TJ14_9BACL|nr:polysaccharide deacetylase family sporulation protein PdaB [Cohnella lubricantis]MBB6679200.1 polysaccharide deacetylase family sporulation protein PdaB [Cohnella lubricantis]MBP2119530.1 polysaccharide deacetylase family sporulation protein PdaB [Cohnella lubricantis]